MTRRFVRMTANVRAAGEDLQRGDLLEVVRSRNGGRVLVLSIPGRKQTLLLDASVVRAVAHR